MATNISTWGDAGTLKEPSQTEVDAGFECGIADPFVFNWIIKQLSNQAAGGTTYTTAPATQITAPTATQFHVRADGFTWNGTIWKDPESSNFTTPPATQNAAPTATQFHVRADGYAWNGTAWIDTAPDGVGGGGGATYTTPPATQNTAPTATQFRVRADGFTWGGTSWIDPREGNLTTPPATQNTAPTATQLHVRADGYVWNGATWVNAAPDGTGVTYTTPPATQTTAPTATQFNVRADGAIWDGTAWVALGGGGIAELTAASPPDAVNGICVTLPTGLYMLSSREANSGVIVATIGYISPLGAGCLRLTQSGWASGGANENDADLAPQRASFDKAWKIG